MITATRSLVLSAIMIISHFAITPGFSQKYGPSKIGSPVMPGEYTESRLFH